MNKDIYINSDTNNKKCIELVSFDSSYNELVLFINSCDNKNELYVTVHKLCLLLNKMTILEDLLKNKIFPNASTICDAIKQYRFDYISILQKYNVPFDVINSVGMTPIEVAISCYINNKNYYNLIIELNKTNYVRNPKYWNICLNLQIYDDTPFSEIEAKFISQMKSIKEPSIATLNNLLVEYYIAINDSNKLIQFVKQNKEFIDESNLFDMITKYHSGDILAKVNTYYKTNIMLECCLKLRYYDIIISNREIIDACFMEKLIKNADHLSLVFIAEYIGISALKIKNRNGDSILHILCAIHDNESKKNEINDMIYCHKIIMKHVFQLINETNNNDETPFFSAHSNNTLMELMLLTGALRKNTNKIGDTFLHHTIRYGTINVLEKILWYDDSLINCQNNDGETPLILATKLKKQDMCNILITKHADITIADNHGNLLDHYMCLYNLTQINHIIGNTENKHNQTPSDYMIEYLYSTIKTEK